MWEKSHPSLSMKHPLASVVKAPPDLVFAELASRAGTTTPRIMVEVPEEPKTPSMMGHAQAPSRTPPVLPVVGEHEPTGER